MKPSLPALWIQPRAEPGTWRDAHPHGHAALPGLSLGQADRADLRVGEGDPRHRVVLGGGDRLAQDVGHHDVRLVHRHVRERALAGDVADRPHSRRGAQVIIHRDGPRPLVDADRADPDRSQVGTPAGGNEQPRPRSPPCRPRASRVKPRVAVAHPVGHASRVHVNSLAAEHLAEQRARLWLLQGQQPAGALDAR